jgi:hypothetical protein
MKDQGGMKATQYRQNEPESFFSFGTIAVFYKMLLD